MSPVIINLLITIFGAFATSFSVWFFTKKKTKAETAKTVAESASSLNHDYAELIKILHDERERDRKEFINRMEAVMKEIRANKLEIQMLKYDNEECKYLHEVSDLEMMHVRRHTDRRLWERELVHVLDDDEDALEDFKNKFKKLSVLEYEGFREVDEFLERTRAKRPPIVVLDYMLPKGTTAEHVIKQLEYDPEIFVMSSEENFELKFKGKNVKFFPKDDNYILKIAKAIIQSLIHREHYSKTEK